MSDIESKSKRKYGITTEDPKCDMSKRLQQLFYQVSYQNIFQIPPA